MHVGNLEEGGMEEEMVRRSKIGVLHQQIVALNTMDTHEVATDYRIA